MTQEQEFKEVSYWIVYTDKGEHRLSDSEVNMLLDAESKGARLVRFDDYILSVPFIKEIRHKHYFKHETQFDKVPEDEDIYVVGIEKRKLLV